MSMMVLDRVSKRFPNQSQDEAALRDVSVAIEPGESLAIVGRSASGKSTLINIMCALVSLTTGKYLFNGRPVAASSSNSRTAVGLRRQIGYVSQWSELLGNFSVRSNVQMAARCRRMRLDDREADRWLETVGLSGLGDRSTSQLSGGQRQRVNIARALACEPSAVIADEPTGSLDVATARGIMELIHELTVNRTLVLVTHVPDYAAACRRQLCLHEGRLLHDVQGMTSAEIVQFIDHPGAALPSPADGAQS